MNARNLLAMFLLLPIGTASTLSGQTARDALSSIIRSHITSSAALSRNTEQSNESEDVESSDSGFSPLFSTYGVNDLWLEIDLDTSDITLVDLTLHGTWSTNVYQLQSRFDLEQSNWNYGEILISPNDGDSFFTPILHASPQQFFRAEQASAAVEIYPVQNAVEPPATQTGIFHVLRRSSVFDKPLTVYYTVSGSATPGVDYTNIPTAITFAVGESDTNIYIQPLADNEIEFDESVTLTLIRTNGYVVDPAYESATVWIQDNLTNVFDVVVTNLYGIGIDYHPVTNALIV